MEGDRKKALLAGLHASHIAVHCHFSQAPVAGHKHAMGGGSVTPRVLGTTADCGIVGGSGKQGLTEGPSLATQWDSNYCNGGNAIVDMGPMHGTDYGMGEVPCQTECHMQDGALAHSRARAPIAASAARTAHTTCCSGGTQGVCRRETAWATTA